MSQWTTAAVVVLHILWWTEQCIGASKYGSAVTHLEDMYILSVMCMRMSSTLYIAWATNYRHIILYYRHQLFKYQHTCLRTCIRIKNTDLPRAQIATKKNSIESMFSWQQDAMFTMHFNAVFFSNAWCPMPLEGNRRDLEDTLSLVAASQRRSGGGPLPSLMALLHWMDWIDRAPLSHWQHYWWLNQFGWSTLLITHGTPDRIDRPHLSHWQYFWLYELIDWPHVCTPDGSPGSSGLTVTLSLTRGTLGGSGGSTSNPSLTHDIPSFNEYYCCVHIVHVVR